jgi:hypothetical protein
MLFNGSANITSNTADGSDNAQIVISGGGAAASWDTRGASIHLAGNENGNGGLLQLRGGSGSVGGIRLYSGGSERLRVTDSGISVTGNISTTTTLSTFTDRIKIINGSDQLNMGQWDGTYHRIEGDVNRAIFMTSYHSAGIVFGSSGSGIATINSDGFVPETDSASDLGSPSKRWANVYTGDLHLSNTEGNDVDGTTGDWTIQEGDEHLYIKNNKTGKKYKFALEEIE